MTANVPAIILGIKNLPPAAVVLLPTSAPRMCENNVSEELLTRAVLRLVWPHWNGIHCR